MNQPLLGALGGGAAWLATAAVLRLLPIDLDAPALALLAATVGIVGGYQLARRSLR